MHYLFQLNHKIKQALKDFHTKILEKVWKTDKQERATIRPLMEEVVNKIYVNRSHYVAEIRYVPLCAM